jgi:hypothetical protein
MKPCDSFGGAIITILKETGIECTIKKKDAKRKISIKGKNVKANSKNPAPNPNTN